MLPGPPCYTASAMNTTFAVLAAAAYLAFLAPLAGALGREVRDPGSGAQRLREVRGLDLWAVFGVLVLHALAFAFATRGDDAFRLLVDRTLSRIYRNGRIDGILAKTFGDASTDEMLKTMFVINSLPDK